MELGVRGRKPNNSNRGDGFKELISPPPWMSRYGKAEWRRVVPALVQRKILTEADLGSLESYCVAHSRIRELERLLHAGFDLKLIRAQDAAIKTARQLAAELGLTPVSRNRPSVRDNDNSADDDNPLAV